MGEEEQVNENIERDPHLNPLPGQGEEGAQRQVRVI